MNEDAGVLGLLMRADELEEQGRWEEAAWTRLYWLGEYQWVRLPAASVLATDMDGDDRLWVWREEGDWAWDGRQWSVLRYDRDGRWVEGERCECPPAVRAAVEAACRVRTEALFEKGDNP